MTIATLLKYLGGRRQAILEIATCRQSLWLGLMFVFSAAFAREYDGADLWHEPWHLALPLTASLATATLLFLLVLAVTRSHGPSLNRGLDGYLSFLSLYWMTAPLAWLYGIPVERLLAPENATRINLCLLAVVALWRVVLMMRVIAVSFNVRRSSAFFTVMFFADTVLLVVLRLSPIPIFQIMGGIRLSPSEQIIQGTAFLVGFVGVVSWLVWLIGMLIAARGGNPRENLVPEPLPAGQVSRSAWVLAAGSIAVWIGILPLTQPEQQLAWRLERALRAGRLEEAATLLAAHERADFPPHWDPPPRLAYGQTFPPAQSVYQELRAAKAKPWALELYADKFANGIGKYDAELFTDDLSDAAVEENLALLEQFPNATQILREHSAQLVRELMRKDRSATLRERIRRMLQEADVKLPDEPVSVPPDDEN